MSDHIQQTASLAQSYYRMGISAYHVIHTHTIYVNVTIICHMFRFTENTPHFTTNKQTNKQASLKYSQMYVQLVSMYKVTERLTFLARLGSQSILTSPMASCVEECVFVCVCVSLCLGQAQSPLSPLEPGRTVQETHFLLDRKLHQRV